MAIVSELGASLLSSFWTKQLTYLTSAVQFIGTEKNDDITFKKMQELPEELKVLYKAIDKSKREVTRVNNNLKQLVDNKTQELKKVNEKLKISASRDYLTKLYNRRAFNQKFLSIWEHRKKGKQLLSFIILDIDFFKDVNDNWGHPAGDEVLIQIAQYLLAIDYMNIHSVSRIGGEEFGIISLEYTHEKSVSIAEHIRSEISNIKITVENKERNKILNITISAGVASINPNKDGVDKLFKLADEALYQAKKSGRNCVRSINIS